MLVLAASAAWRAVLVPVLAASSWPPRVLVQALAVALTPRALALQRAGVLMPRERAQPLAVASTRALVLQGPF